MALISEGLGNAAIAERLSISDKTVRNHVSNLFDKLGVWTRAQAIVFARDRGFSGTEGQLPTPNYTTPNGPRRHGDTELQKKNSSVPPRLRGL